MRILARHEAHRLGLVVSSRDVQILVDEFRLLNNLTIPEDMKEWISSTGLTKEGFMRMMYDLTILRKLEESYNLDIEREIQDHARFSASHEKFREECLSINSIIRRIHWLQVNVALERHEGGALPSARALFEQLYPAIGDWRREKILKSFFFMRKPPDVRLRFFVPDSEAKLLTELETILSRLKQDGFVRYFFPSVYEPEIFQFGGNDAMNLVHAYFDADSMAWISLDRIAISGKRMISTETLVLAVMNDLFFRTLECPYEVWDVWCNLESLIPASQEMSQAKEIFFVDSLSPHASKEEAYILQDYVDANHKLSMGLQQVWSNGKLQYGLRAILPFIAKFHFNRHGLDAERQAVLIGAMKQAWNPKKNLIGIEDYSTKRGLK